MQFQWIVLYALSLLALYALGYFCLVPMKWAGRLLVSAILGAVALFVLNLLGGGMGLHIALNPVTALITGLLGVPGVALLVVVSALM